MSGRRWGGLALVAASVLTACATATGTIGGGRPTTVTPPSDAAGRGTPSVTTVSPAPSVRVPRPVPSPPVARSSPALLALARLPVKGRAPRTGYDRALFGSAWTDDTTAPGGHNGCDTRNDILRRDLTEVVIKPGTYGCLVLSGTLHDPYTGRVIDFVRGPGSIRVQIDHVVALSDAWQKGAQQLTAAQRTAFANDPLELLAVDGPTNEAKGDGDAATWLPPNRPFRCAYAARQIAVKAKYALWVTTAERDALARVLARCPGQRLPTE